MMRFILVNVVTIGLMLVGATSASAISFFFGAPSATELLPGESFTIQLRLNTDGETNVTSVFMSTFHNSDVLTFVSGASPGQILFNTSSFEGIGRVSQPFVLGGDPLGTTRAASFAALSPSGISSANQLLATLTFQATGVGTTNFASLLAAGDDVTVDGQSVGSNFGVSSSVTVIPEPATALLMGLGLAGLAAAGRRRD
jgi:hypothetical protein